MKRFIFSFLTFCTLSVYGQTYSFNYLGKEIILDHKLVEHYSSEYIEDYKKINPEILIYQNYFVLNSFKVVDLSEKAKHESFIKISQIEKIPSKLSQLDYSVNIESFNILNFDIQLKENQQIIDMEHDNKFLIIDSKAEFLKKFNEYSSFN